VLVDLSPQPAVATAPIVPEFRSVGELANYLFLSFFIQQALPLKSHSEQ